MTYIQYTPSPKKDVFLIDMRDELTKPRSELVRKGLTKFLHEGKNIAIVVNKKGFATGSTCNECGYIPRCDHCDIAIAIHKQLDGNDIGLCHICKCQYSVDAQCKQCGGTDTRFYGLGAQQVAKRLLETYGVHSVLLDSSTTNSPNKAQSLVDSLQGAKVVIGTSLLSQPIRSRKPDVVIVVHADFGLHIPDFQSDRNTFLLLDELIRRQDASIYLLQTYNPEHHAMTHACSGDIAGMKDIELTHRRQCNYPPFTQMCTLLYKHEIEERLFTSTNKLFQELLYLKDHYDMTDLEIYTTPPMIYKMFGKYRYTIILKGKNLREFMDIAYSKLKISSRGFKVDWEPQQLL